MLCGKLNGQKLEKLQERALRSVKDMVSTYKEILEKGEFLPVTMHRIFFFKFRLINIVAI